MEVHPVSRNYDAYGGSPASVVGARSAYTGEIGERPGNAYFLGSRLYMPFLRRFLSADPVSPFDAGGLNRYAYCSGDPMGRIDPSGRSWWHVLGLLADRAEARVGTTNIASIVGTADAPTPSLVRRAATAAVSWGASIGGAVGRRVQRVERRISGDPGKAVISVRHGGGTVRVHVGRGWQDVTKRETRIAFTENGLPQREYRTLWRTTLNASGAAVHLPDSVVTPKDAVKRALSQLGQPNSRGGVLQASDMVIIAGGHGSANGRNWTGTQYWKSPDDVKWIRDHVDQLIGRGRSELRGIHIQDITGMTRDDYQALLRGDRTVVGGICFLAADEATMQALDYDVMDTFILRLR